MGGGQLHTLTCLPPILIAEEAAFSSCFSSSAILHGGDDTLGAEHLIVLRSHVCLRPWMILYGPFSKFMEFERFRKNFDKINTLNFKIFYID